VNNYEDSDLTNVNTLQESSKYLIVGQERGIEGTRHLQGYVTLKNPKTFSAMKVLLPRAHLEVAKGNAQQNKTYCSKEGDIYIEYGELPRSGKRTDLEKVEETIIDNPDCPLRSVIKSGANLQAIRVAEKYLTYFEAKRDWKPEVYWFYGVSGSGKSYTAFSTAGENYYVCQETDQWWDGYDGQDVVIIDDMRKNFCTFNRLLVLLDQYECRIQVKGGYRQLLAKKIFITTCYAPEEMYSTREDIFQLQRRITEVVKFEEQFEEQKDTG